MRAMPRWIITFFFLVALTAACCAEAETPSSTPSPPISSASEILGLSSEEASRGTAVRITGVVLLVSSDEGAIVVQDDSGAVYVHVGSAVTPHVQRSDLVSIEGTTHPGRFAPVVKPASCRVIGTAPIPPALRVSLSDLSNGAHDGQWVEVTGMVRAVTPLPGKKSNSLVELVAEEVRLPGLFYGVDPAVAKAWIDSQLTVRGVCFHFYNKKGQLFDTQIGVPAGEQWELQPPPAPDPYLLPVRPLSSLLRYERHGWDPHRVHVRGVVIYSKPGHFFFIQEGDDGLRVNTRSIHPPALGEVVDVVGFTARGPYGPILDDADFRMVRIREPITARRVDLHGALNADAELVSVEGRLVSSFLQPDESLFLVEIGQALITAHLPRSTKAETPSSVENGSWVVLTGVCQAIMGSPARNQWKWAPHSFELLLRSPSDIAVIAPPAWWTTSRIFQAVLGVLLVVTAGLVFSFLRSRAKLQEQRQNRLAAEAQFAAVFNERNRMARELHDTLAQGLTGISIQIEMAKERRAVPAAALEHLEIARTLVRTSLSEARRSVWGLRPQISENHDLPAALREISRQLTTGTGISIQVKATPESISLPPSIEADFLRIGQEALTNAVKHAQARNILVQVQVTPDLAQLRVSDDGCGCTPSTHLPPGPRSGLGVVGMRERAAQLNGKFSLRDRAGRGTELFLEVPLPLPPEPESLPHPPHH